MKADIGKPTELMNELAQEEASLDDVIAAAELRLKMLRHIKSLVEVKNDNPKPRKGRAQKETAAA